MNEKSRGNSDPSAAKASADDEIVAKSAKAHTEAIMALHADVRKVGKMTAFSNITHDGHRTFYSNGNEQVSLDTLPSALQKLEEQLNVERSALQAISAALFLVADIELRFDIKIRAAVARLSGVPGFNGGDDAWSKPVDDMVLKSMAVARLRIRLNGKLSGGTQFEIEGVAPWGTVRYRMGGRNLSEALADALDYEREMANLFGARTGKLDRQTSSAIGLPVLRARLLDDHGTIKPIALHELDEAVAGLEGREGRHLRMAEWHQRERRRPAKDWFPEGWI